MSHHYAEPTLRSMHARINRILRQLDKQKSPPQRCPKKTATDNPVLALTAKQQKAAQAIATGLSMQEAAAEAGCSGRTLRQWQTREDFQAGVRHLKKEIYEAAIARLVESAESAVPTLTEICNDKESPANTRLSAAKYLFDLAGKRIDDVALSDRMAALEAKLGALERQ